MLATQSAELQDCIFKTSILGPFCADRCVAVCAADDKAGQTAVDRRQEWVDAMQHADLFTIALDEYGYWFRYHHLFQQEMLKEPMRRVDTAGIQALHRRASDWLAEGGLVEEAIRHALAGGDALRAARLVEEHRCDESQIVPWRLPTKWLPYLPERLKR